MKLGDCFEVAVETMYINQHFTLVHGLPFGLGGDAEGLRYSHAWCEHEGLIYDATMNIEGMPIELYYSLGDITVTHKYNYVEMANNLVMTEVYGPWADEIISNGV